ncbi:unnamed protein product [Penicillium camemberti]|uniref:Str. FM013 n=1 Tax=Penicillium camemberti (strain FM 013) TaxID=1429867 RepID=A0A0G4PLU9_PENC3|nr:unnamed protein product [Penicillium camemberti]
MLHSKKIDLQNYINLRLVIRPEEFWASFPIDGKLVINEGGAAEAVSGNDAASTLVSHGAASLSRRKHPELRTPTRAVGDVVRIPGSAVRTKEWQALLLQPLPQHSSAAPATLPYQRVYDSASGSPAEGGPVSDAPPLGLAPGRLYQINPVGHNQPTTTQLQRKRAQRQRRKDPICDACRERRVRCQFTKETNRRILYIEQFQDLEKQLQNSK